MAHRGQTDHVHSHSRGKAAGGSLQLLIHNHAWFVGVGGVLLGLFLLVYVPRLEAVSRSLFLFAGFHLVGAVLLLASLYALAPRARLRRVLGRHKREARTDEYDFGWGPEWMNGLALVALVMLFVAVAINVVAPAWWPLALVVAVFGAFFVVGNLMMQSFRNRDHVVLPMVGLLRSDDDLVLDAGCGAGRTTIALSRVLRSGRVVAVDRFDAGYIDDGGRTLLDRNLRVAGLDERVRVEKADLVSLPFADGTFDGAVSTSVFDHLGKAKGRALAEVFRTLKPGGRFLVAVSVPGWEMFMIANVLSFFLASRKTWRRLATAAGFDVVDEGVFNFAWFALLEKPAA